MSHVKHGLDWLIRILDGVRKRLDAVDSLPIATNSGLAQGPGAPPRGWEPLGREAAQNGND
jgi:hypothetical protein